jgi:hypothetical protein
MPNLAVNRITNANVYLDGVGLLGRAEEIEVAKPKHKMVDHKGLGMARNGGVLGRGRQARGQDQVGVDLSRGRNGAEQPLSGALLPGPQQSRNLH